MMKGIRSSAAVALLATAARAAEEVAEKAAEQVAAQAPEAVKQVITNENAAGWLASALNAVSHCPTAVSDTLTATVGENPYVRVATAATTVAIGLGTAYLAFSSCGKKKAAKPTANSTPSSTTPAVPENNLPEAGNDGSNPGSANSSAHTSGDEDNPAVGAEGEAYEQQVEADVSTTRRRTIGKK